MGNVRRVGPVAGELDHESAGVFPTALESVKLLLEVSLRSGCGDRSRGIAVLDIGAAAEAGRVVVVVAAVRRGAIAATFAVLDRVHEEPADESAGRIRDPLVHVADQVV